MVGVNGKDLAVEGFGFGGAAGVVKGDGVVESLGDSEFGHGWNIADRETRRGGDKE
jgi:hypothetical protein